VNEIWGVSNGLGRAFILVIVCGLKATQLMFTFYHKRDKITRDESFSFQVTWLRVRYFNTPHLELVAG